MVYLFPTSSSLTPSPFSSSVHSECSVSALMSLGPIALSQCTILAFSFIFVVPHLTSNLCSPLLLSYPISTHHPISLTNVLQFTPYPLSQPISYIPSHPPHVLHPIPSHPVLYPPPYPFSPPMCSNLNNPISSFPAPILNLFTL